MTGGGRNDGYVLIHHFNCGVLLVIAKGDTDTYTVALDYHPDSDVTVSLEVSPSGHLTVSSSEFVFTPETWDTAQTVTLTAESYDGNQSYWQEIVHTSSTEGFVSGHVKVLIK